MNAFVLPGGKVFVYSGILSVADTDDRLAAILGHEIAHNLARHTAESMSKYYFIQEPLRWMVIFLDQAIGLGGLGHIVWNLFIGPAVLLPASRAQESEADYIGLMMMAKSCYDPSQAVTVWECMQRAEKASGAQMPEWLSTHPANSTRIAKMQEWLPKAQEKRSEYGCAIASGNWDAFRETTQLLSPGLWRFER